MDARYESQKNQGNRVPLARILEMTNVSLFAIAAPLNAAFQVEDRNQGVFWAFFMPMENHLMRRAPASGSPAADECAQHSSGCCFFVSFEDSSSKDSVHTSCMSLVIIILCLGGWFYLRLPRLY